MKHVSGLPLSASGAKPMNVLAVDLGGSHATCALVTERGVRAIRRLALAESAGLEPVLPSLARVLRELTSEAGVRLSACAGVGFAFPGLVDTECGRVLSTNEKFADSISIDLDAWSGAELGLPLRLENDARAALLGERRAGAAQGCDDLVMMTLGTGIGGSAMIGGKLVRGKHHQAGVLGGHFPIRFDGRRCTCGNVGCAEAEASTWALPGICAEWPGYERSALAKLDGRIDYAALYSAAESGDAVATEVRDHSLAIWAAAAVALVHAYDPDLLVVGGGVMGSATTILPFVERHVHQHAWTPWGEVQVRGSTLGDEAALLGVMNLFE